MSIMDLFMSDTPKNDVFILVREGKTGIETYVSPKIKTFPEAYKGQLRAFLTGVLKDLGGK